MKDRKYIKELEGRAWEMKMDLRRHAPLLKRICDHTDHPDYEAAVDAIFEEIATLLAEGGRKQEVINKLCEDSGMAHDLLRDTLPYVPCELKERMIDLGIIDIDGDPASTRQDHCEKHHVDKSIYKDGLCPFCDPKGPGD